MFSVNDYFKANPQRVRKAVTCKSGLTLSIQASRTHYCSPQANEGPYSLVEVMVCTDVHPRAFIKDKGRRAEDGVYGWVPVSLVQAVIEKNGGVA